MTDLHPICALGGAAPQSARFGALSLRENPDLALASVAHLRGGQSDLPRPGPGLWQQDDGIAAFWTGPDQWMIEGAGLAASDFAATVAARAPGCAVTEQTDGFVAFEITSDSGAAPIRTLLEKLVNIDAQGFGPGRASRTGLHHMSIFIIRRAEHHLAVLGMRSAAGTIWHALTQAAARQQEITP